MLTVRVLAAFNVALAILLLAALLLAPIVVDSIHMADTLLLAHLGWRGINGLTPVIDYPHFYGGVTAQFVTYAFELFGVSFKSIHYAFTMMYVSAAAVLCFLCWRRLSWPGIALLLALAAALILSLYPIEVSPSSGTVAAHSFSYNHVGMVLMLAVTAFALRQVDDRRIEVAAALIAGIVLYALILLKTTFGTMLPSIILACLVQARWRSAFLVLAGAIAGMLMMDPGLVRALGSLDLMLVSEGAARSGGVRDVIRSAVLMVKESAGLLFVVMVPAGLVLLRQGRSALPLLVAMTICAAGYGMAMMTTGGSHDYKLMPLLALLALFLSDRLTAESPPSAPARSGASPPDTVLLRALAYCIVYALISPMILVAGSAFVKSFMYSGSALIDEGPLAGYFVDDPAIRYIPGIWAAEAAERRAAAISVVSRRLEERADRHPGSSDLANRGGGFPTPSDEYVVLADGVALLQGIPDVASYGIVPSGRMFDFTMPLGSRPVPSFPVWPIRGLPGLADPGRLGADVDLVMMAVDVPEWELVNEDLRELMGAEFRACRSSTFWTLYARRAVPESLCASDSP